MRQSNWRLFIAVLLLVGITNVSHGQTDADFDSDGEVGFADFLMFAGAFNSTESKYDLNGNGTVDFPDFILLSGLFGQKAGSSDLTVTLSDSVQMAFVYISPGTFMMGSPNIVSEIGRERDELPQHEVTISEGFYLGKYEVTQAQWETVMGTTPWSGRSNVQSN
ncbi:MAG: SUMF1/EgtB/PvdO family nonheme iron enzyme, partial [Candidatus Latescibacteria bacterium]|nr:SUMF1/EgtB/PvdO family nonheme iron enzyme [Candidatus Latescibacterota bacterium]